MRVARIDRQCQSAPSWVTEPLGPVGSRERCGASIRVSSERCGRCGRCAIDSPDGTRPPLELAHPPPRPPLALVVLAGAAAACEAAAPWRPRRSRPAHAGAPREVNLIAKDYEFLPATLDLVPGETVLLHVINGGLDVHEAIIGSEAVQDAWERAEGAVAGAPPGPTPVVSVPPEVSGLRIVVESGQRVDVAWTVPLGRSRRRTASLHRGLPYPRPLGARDADPRALGRRLVKRARWYALDPRRRGALLRRSDTPRGGR